MDSSQLAAVIAAITTMFGAWMLYRRDALKVRASADERIATARAATDERIATVQADGQREAARISAEASDRSADAMLEQAKAMTSLSGKIDNLIGFIERNTPVYGVPVARAAP